MIRFCSQVALFLAATAIFLFVSRGVWESRAQVRATHQAAYIVPSSFSRILALGNKGLLSDFLFLKVTTYIGGKDPASGALAAADWEYLRAGIDVITDLDPYFVDPYMLAEGMLAWDAGMPEAANQLLEKGRKYRSFDWRMPFFIGFNNFYFLKKYDTASEYIMQASRMSGSPRYLSTLGARLAYYGGKSQTALLFLQEMLADTDDSVMKARLQKRLLALKGAVEIETALSEYLKQTGRTPSTLQELVSNGFLQGLPPEPYGGTWVILKSGRVFSTSKFVSARKINKGK